MDILHLNWSMLIGVLLGLGLSISSGFRVFIPLFLVSLIINLNIESYLVINNSWRWLGDLPTLITLGIALIIEIASYYIPKIDKLLDTMVVPLSAISGTLLMGSQLIDLTPLLTWSLAIFIGGGISGLIKLITTLEKSRFKKQNNIKLNLRIITIETIFAFIVGILAFFIPILIFIFLLILTFGTYKIIQKNNK